MFSSTPTTGKLKGCSPEALSAEILSLTREIGLEDKLDDQAEKLSGGQKRKLSVCMALIGNSRVIFLDEPTSGVGTLFFCLVEYFLFY